MKRPDRSDLFYYTKIEGYVDYLEEVVGDKDVFIDGLEHSRDKLGEENSLLKIHAKMDIKIMEKLEEENAELKDSVKDLREEIDWITG